MIEKQIELIQNQIDKLEHKEFDLSAWKSSTILVLDRIFGNDFQGIKSIENIKYKSGGIATGSSSSFWNNMSSFKKQGKDILETCITELKTFGEREKTANIDSGININLTQNQTVNLNLIINALEDELTVSQMKELKKIMKDGDTKADKKKKIIDKIKGFGSDVAVNILTNILTNPAIWG
ncbi:MAG: Uncharacterised protein [SAR116 cluster bacterium]|nr:MAG: Uncharacterised protein [SAR116 cluster bacterium]